MVQKVAKTNTGRLFRFTQYLNLVTKFSTYPDTINLNVIYSTVDQVSARALINLRFQYLLKCALTVSAHVLRFQ